MSRDPETGLPEHFLADMARRSPYGTHPDVRDAALAPFSEASHEAAVNLLTKALRRLSEGDAEKADRMIARAAALPFDEREHAWPGTGMAEQMLFDLLADQAEEVAAFLDGDLEDDEWDEDLDEIDEGFPVPLEPVVAYVAEQVGPAEGVALRDAVETVADDGALYGIGPEQAGRLREAVAALPVGPSGRAIGPEAGTAERESVIRAHLMVYLRVAVETRS